MDHKTVDYGCFGYAPSPLDPWRGTGRIAKQMGLPVPAPPAAQPMTKSSLFLPVPPPVDRKTTVDPAVATIKIKVSKSPCPCGDEECNKIDMELDAYKELMADEYKKRGWVK